MTALASISIRVSDQPISQSQEYTTTHMKFRLHVALYENPGIFQQ